MELMQMEMLINDLVNCPNLKKLETKRKNWLQQNGLDELGKQLEGTFYYDSIKQEPVFLSDDDLFMFEVTGDWRQLLKR